MTDNNHTKDSSSTALQGWEPKTPGPEPLPIDPKQVEDLATAGMRWEEIAAVLDCSADTLQRRFAAEYKRGYYKKKGALRVKQVSKALDGDVKMLIWLGKQELGQKEKIAFGIDDPFEGSTGYEFVSEPPPKDVTHGSEVDQLSDDSDLEDPHSTVELQADNREESRASEAENPDRDDDAWSDSEFDPT